MANKWILGLVLACGCAAQQQPAESQVVVPSGTEPRASEPASDVDCHSILTSTLRDHAPANWNVETVRDGTVEPIQWPVGVGRELRAYLPGTSSGDWKRGRGGEVRVWIMAPSYAGQAQPDEMSQLSPARELGICAGQRVMVTGIGNQEWPSWESDLRDALHEITGCECRLALTDEGSHAGRSCEPALVG